MSHEDKENSDSNKRKNKPKYLYLDKFEKHRLKMDSIVEDLEKKNEENRKRNYETHKLLLKRTNQLAILAGITIGIVVVFLVAFLVVVL